MKSALRFLLRFFRPHLPKFVLVLLFTVGVALSSAAQAYLIQPLLNRVLLKGSDSEGEEEDDDWFEPLGVTFAGQLTGAPAAPGGGLEQELDGLRVFGGRAVPDPAWNDDPLCRLLERSRGILQEVGRNLDPADAQPKERLLGAVRLQRGAEALALPAPGKLTPLQRARAADLSRRARAEARLASFESAWAALKWILIAALILAVLLGVFRYLQVVTTRIIVVRIFTDMQVEVVRHVLTLAAGQLDSMRRGDLLTRLNADLAKVANGVVLPITGVLLLQPIQLVVFLAVAIYLSWWLSLILLVLALTVLGPVRWGGRLIRRSASARQSALAEVLEAMHQMFAGVRIVKAFRREEYEKARFGEKTERAYNAEVGVITARSASRSWLRMINDITIPLVVLAGGWLVVKHVGGMNAGRFSAFAALVMLMYRPTKSLAMAYNTLQDSLPSLKRVRELLAQEPAIVDADDAVSIERIEQGLSVEGLSFSYDGETEVLREISFDAPRGTTTAFVGHTGSGKSTLMDLLARHIDPTRGEVRVDGRPLTRIRLATYLERVAVVSQHTFLFNDTVRENIRYGRLDASDEEIEAAARVARVHDEIMALPGGYDYVAGEMGSKLSGGQIQRLTLARAVVRRPELLLLDEATSALDTRTERLVQEALDEIEKTCTTFVIAHRLSTVRHADQILVLDGGRLVERGTHDELLASGGRYAQLVHTLQRGDDSGNGAGSSRVDPILHITRREAWEEAQAAGTYRGDTLESEGFIHLSTPAQVLTPANALFRGQQGLVLLRVDPARLSAELRYEDLTGAGEAFPHLYGPLEVEAVTEVLPFEPGEDGSFSLPAGLV